MASVTHGRNMQTRAPFPRRVMLPRSSAERNGNETWTTLRSTHVLRAKDALCTLRRRCWNTKPGPANQARSPHPFARTML